MKIISVPEIVLIPIFVESCCVSKIFGAFEKMRPMVYVEKFGRAAWRVKGGICMPPKAQEYRHMLLIVNTYYY